MRKNPLAMLVSGTVVATCVGLTLFAICKAYVPKDSYYAEDPAAIYYGGSVVCYSFDTHTRVDKIPDLLNTWQMTTECRVNPEEVFTAISMFYKAWTDEFGPDKGLRIFKAFNNLTIEWAEEPLAISDDEWERIFGEKPDTPKLVYGEATWHTAPNIWVVRGMTGSLYDEPKRFLHELVHIALRASNPASGGDFDHEGPIIKAWTKRHTKLIQTVGDYIITLNQEDDI